MMKKSIRQRPRLTCLRAEYASPSAVHEADYQRRIQQYRTVAGGTLRSAKKVMSFPLILAILAGCMRTHVVSFVLPQRKR